jgi:hypothetical protein
MSRTSSIGTLSLKILCSITKGTSALRTWESLDCTDSKIPAILAERPATCVPE